MSQVTAAFLFLMFGCIATYRALPDRYQLQFVSLLTVLVLAWYSPISLGILVVTTTATYWLAHSGYSRGSFSLVAVALLTAGFSAYRFLLIPSIAEDFQIAVLLGFAFYMLRAIHYVIEGYQGRLPPHDFAHYLAYMFFLPTLIAGPIHRFPEFMREARRRRWDAAQFSEGAERVLFGYAKAVVLGNYVISNRLAAVVSSIDPERAGLIAYLECLVYGANLYFQFAGYSDIAIGFSRMLGIRVVENFNWPFLQKNINEFWNCWHISLSSWCRDYIYMPVVAQTRRPAVAVVSSMMVLGLWHEFTLRYVLWAVYHGLGIVGWRQFQGLKDRLGLPRIENPRLKRVADGLSILVTVNFVMLSFAITKELQLAETLRVYREIFSFRY